MKADESGAALSTLQLLRAIADFDQAAAGMPSRSQQVVHSGYNFRAYSGG